MNLSSSDTMPQFPGEFWTLLGVVFAFILLAVLAPVWCEKAQQAIVGPFSRLAARKTLVIGVLFFSIIGVRLAVLPRSEEHTSELQSRLHLVCRLLLEKKKKIRQRRYISRLS